MILHICVSKIKEPESTLKMVLFFNETTNAVQMAYYHFQGTSRSSGSMFGKMKARAQSAEMQWHTGEGGPGPA